MKKLEKVDEQKFVRYVLEQGDLCPKVGWHGQRGWPDREVVMSDNRHFYIEFKRKGEELRPLQKHIHELLRKRGHSVYVTDNYQEAIRIYHKEKDRREQT